jgi:hypothetical protein
MPGPSRFDAFAQALLAGDRVSVVFFAVLLLGI